MGYHGALAWIEKTVTNGRGENVSERISPRSVLKPKIDEEVVT